MLRASTAAHRVACSALCPRRPAPDPDMLIPSSVASGPSVRWSRHSRVPAPQLSVQGRGTPGQGRWSRPCPARPPPLLVSSPATKRGARRTGLCPRTPPAEHDAEARECRPLGPTPRLRGPEDRAMGTNVRPLAPRVIPHRSGIRQPEGLTNAFAPVSPERPWSRQRESNP